MGFAPIDRALTQLLCERRQTIDVPGVELITTHISWVLRTREEVFKCKRPVHYDFVDFSSRQARAQACEEEVRLNRRLAPDVYRGVRSVGVCHGQAHVMDDPSPGPAGAEVIDHVVHMRRLADADAAHVRLREGRLGSAQVRALATRLAAFYGELPLCAGEDFTCLACTNLRELAHASAGAPQVVPPGEVAALLETTRVQLAALHVCLGRRGAHTCDGHGDLRLEHIYFEQDAAAPLLIDAVEFQPAFRRGDWALDVAFAAMELLLAGRDDLAAELWSHLAEARGDYGFYPLVDAYVMHRAAVRTKVALLALQNGGAASASQEQSQREACQRLWRTAVQAGARRHRGRAAVVCVGGVVGSGKSHVAQHLVPRLLAPRVSSDITRKRLAGLAASAQGTAELYTLDRSRLTLEAMVADARAVLRGGRAVILDATFRSRAWRQAARALADREGVPFIFVHTVCADDVLRTRLRVRTTGPQVSDARESLLPQIRAEWEELTDVPDAVTVDTTIADRLHEHVGLAAIQNRLVEPHARTEVAFARGGGAR